MIDHYFNKYRQERYWNLGYIIICVIIYVLIASFYFFLSDHMTLIVSSISIICLMSLYTILLIFRASRDFFSIKEMKYYIMSCQNLKELQRAKYPCNKFIRSCILQYDKRKKAYEEIYSKQFNKIEINTNQY